MTLKKEKSSNEYDWIFPVIIRFMGNNKCCVKYPDFPDYPEYFLENYDENLIKGRLINIIYSKFNNLNKVPKPKDIKIDDILNKNSMIKFIGINKKEIHNQFDNNRVEIKVEIPFYLNVLIKEKDMDLDLNKIMIIGLLRKLNLL